jgi:hypothetical protein
MRNWLVNQYNDIKGSFKWSCIAALWWVAIHYGRQLLQLIPNIPGWLVTSILLCLSLVMLLWLAKSAKKSPIPIPAVPQMPASQTIGIPTISALQAQAPQITFNAQEFFRLAYYSPVTAEVENNIKIIAQQNQPGDREGFLARFIGVGYVAITYQMTWLSIFKSQLLMLTELNRRIMTPAAEAKKYYDKAAADYPSLYAQYTFEQWIDYMKGELLLIRHPSDMLEITHRGRDLLKFVVHWGYDFNAKTG